MVRARQYLSAYQILSKYSRRSKSYSPYSVSEMFASVRLFIMKSGIEQSHWLDLVIIYLHTKNYQNIPSGLKVIHHIQFLKIYLGEAIYKTPHDPDFVFLLAIVEVNIYTKFHKD